MCLAVTRDISPTISGWLLVIFCWNMIWLCQVEYLPSTVAADCWPLLKEFIIGLLGSDVSSALDPPSQHFMATFSAPQTPSDVAFQYLEHFNNFRKAVSPLQRWPVAATIQQTVAYAWVTLQAFSVWAYSALTLLSRGQEGHLARKKYACHYYICLMAFFSRTAWVSQQQKGRTILDFTEQEMIGWQWHQLDHMQIIYTSLQTCPVTMPTPQQSVFTGGMLFLDR